MPEQQQGQQAARRTRGLVSSLTIKIVHLRKPWVIAWWSATFPGLGHVLLGSYIKGFVLFVWELLVNTQANLNLAIVYSFTGQFELARDTLNIRWALLYAPVWVGAIWSSHRLAVDLNKYTVLAAREDAPLPHAVLTTLEVDFLDRRTPWVSLAWSLVAPGFGQLYCHCLPTGFFILAWWIIIVHQSQVLPAVHFTFIGDFAAARAAVVPQWLLFIPSIYCFAAYEAYVKAVEFNRFFSLEQAQHLRKAYQSRDFPMPL